jgi:hypothetical protein
MIRRLKADFLSLIDDGTGRRRFRARQYFDESGFARTVFTAYTKDFSTLERDADII